jgi:hypothetical protein
MNRLKKKFRRCSETSFCRQAEAPAAVLEPVFLKELLQDFAFWVNIQSFIDFFYIFSFSSCI